MRNNPKSKNREKTQIYKVGIREKNIAVMKKEIIIIRNIMLINLELNEEEEDTFEDTRNKQN